MRDLTNQSVREINRQGNGTGPLDKRPLSLTVAQGMIESAHSDGS